ncbi:MAG: peptidylprolyl isomerase [Clostridiales bacterium]|jgi:hypothetical protein|nr:peptidylprolyl isomerase [Clostridiales bacterium]
MMKSNTAKKKLWFSGILVALILTLMMGCGSPAADADDDANGRGAEAAGAANDDAVGPTFEGDFAVARVNRMYVNASDIGFLEMQAQNMLMWEYFEMFGEFEIDRQREFRDGVVFERVLREEMVRQAAFTKIYQEYARQLGITLTDEDYEMIEAHIDNFREQFGEQELEVMLYADGIRGTTHLWEIYRSQIIFENLLMAIVDDPAEFARFEAYMPEEEELPEEELLGAKHILASFDNFDSEEEAEDFANDILARALAGEDFAMLMAEYGQDPGMMANPQGYTFVSGVMVSEFEQATMELEIGEISGLVRSDFGFHIIMRIEPDEDNVMRPPGAPAPRTLQDRMFEAIFLGLQTMADEAEIEFLPALEDVVLMPQG